MAATATPCQLESYLANVAITTAYVFVTKGAAAGSCELPDAVGETDYLLGIAQTTAAAGEMVLVAKSGSSYLKLNGSITRGDRISAEYTAAGSLGKGVVIAEPTAPTITTHSPDVAVAAEVTSAIAYATSILTCIKRTAAIAEMAGSDEDLIVVSLGKAGVY